jgi:hypothetical protein
VSTLDELLEQARTIKMTQAQEREQRLDFAYGNLAASSNHKPRRSAFRNLALTMGMSEENFNVWAVQRSWRSDPPSPEKVRLLRDNVVSAAVRFMAKLQAKRCLAVMGNHTEAECLPCAVASLLEVEES